MFAIVRSSWSVRDRERSFRHPGKGKAKTAGTWIDELASLEKCICLCEFCKRKWKPAKAGYERVQAVPGYNHVRGACDGCKQFTQCTMFLPKKRATK